MTLPMMLIIMILGLINGLAGETEVISENIGVSKKLFVIEEGETEFTNSIINESVIDVLKHPKIGRILPQRLAQVSIRFADNIILAEGLGVNQTALMDFSSTISIEAGTAPSENEESSALLGSELAKRLPNLKSTLPGNISIGRWNQTDQFNITVTGIAGGKGNYLDDLILSPSMFIKLFPEASQKISFIELELRDTSEVEETIETLQRQARSKGHRIQIVSEQAQTKITNRILNDILVIFWTFGLFAFFIVGIQTHFAVKWIMIHYRREFATLRCLGTSTRTIGGILFFCAMLLTNIALVLAIIVGILSATALLASATIFTQTTRYFASVDLVNMLLVVILANIATILGSVREIRGIGKTILIME
jgi:ABC-type antimicrobial peptide transport system permease subunit